MSNRFTITLSPGALDLLKKATVTGDVIRLHTSPVDPKLYRELDKAFQAAGGKWNKTQKGHLFPTDAATILKQLQNDGSIKDDAKENKVTRQAYYTPAYLAEEIALLATVTGHRVLEPSAGHGNIAAACWKMGAIAVDCVEIDTPACQHLLTTGLASALWNVDFLGFKPSQRWDRVLMNPPFNKGQLVKHIMHALEHCLDVTGELWAVTLGTKKWPALEDALDAKYGQHVTYKVVKNWPADAFQNGANVPTCLYRIAFT